jgi:hypothetical protein
MCAILAISRSWYYAAPPPEDDTALRDRIEEIVLEFPGLARIGGRTRSSRCSWPDSR